MCAQLFISDDPMLMSLTFYTHAWDRTSIQLLEFMKNESKENGKTIIIKNLRWPFVLMHAGCRVLSRFSIEPNALPWTHETKQTTNANNIAEEILCNIHTPQLVFDN